MIELKGGRVPIKAWIEGVPLEDQARKQLENTASVSIVHPHLAVLPDVHWGLGATVGSVVPTKGAIIPAAVGCDLGCGMMSVRTSLRAKDLPDSLSGVRAAIEKAVPHGRTDDGGANDRGAWKDPPETIRNEWSHLHDGYRKIVEKHPKLDRGATVTQLGTLGTGNHFIEVCLDEEQQVWVMLHSGSRGVGNRIGSYFIARAKEEMLRLDVHLPDKDLSYLSEGTQYFDDYVEAVGWAQSYARANREAMMDRTLKALSGALGRPVTYSAMAVQCHHNYISRELHFGEVLWITRKGAVRAGRGELGIIPSSMGAKSFIVRGKGNPDSFESCSHGAGRKMSRGAAKKTFTLEDHAKATAGVECRKDAEVIDETPGAYKDIDSVMAAQRDLVDVVFTLKQVLCVKG